MGQISKKRDKKDISLGQYQHTTVKRVNNPQVGLVSSDLDSKPKKKTYQHDPYIDPTLSDKDSWGEWQFRAVKNKPMVKDLVW